MTGLMGKWRALSKRQQWVVGGVVAGLLGWGLYASKLGHGLWLARNVYVYQWEPQREARQLRERQEQLKRDIDRFVGAQGK